MHSNEATGKKSKGDPLQIHRGLLPLSYIPH